MRVKTGESWHGPGNGGVRLWRKRGIVPTSGTGKTTIKKYQKLRIAVREKGSSGITVAPIPRTSEYYGIGGVRGAFNCFRDISLWASFTCDCCRFFKFDFQIRSLFNTSICSSQSMHIIRKSCEVISCVQMYMVVSFSFLIIINNINKFGADICCAGSVQFHCMGVWLLGKNIFFHRPSERLDIQDYLQFEDTSWNPSISLCCDDWGASREGRGY